MQILLVYKTLGIARSRLSEKNRKTADLYIRVSAVEQADKWYSQWHQPAEDTTNRKTSGPVPAPGFLICPVCGWPLTASGLQALRLRYYDYSCLPTCPLLVNDKIDDHLTYSMCQAP